MSSYANATTTVANFFSKTPVKVCQPSDSDTNCSSGTGTGTPGGSGTNLQHRVDGSTFGGVSGSGVDSNGNVGLGSTSPGQKLDVQGTVRSIGLYTSSDAQVMGNLGIGVVPGSLLDVEGSSGGEEMVTVVNNDEGGGVNIITTGGGIGLLTQSSDGTGIKANTNNALTKAFWGVQSNAAGYSAYFQGGKNYFSGNVGIGVLTPALALDVQGTVGMTGFNLSTSPTNGYVLTSDGSGNGTWQAGGGGSQTPWAQDIDAATFKLKNTGNIGIATSNAQAKLDIVASGGVRGIYVSTSASLASRGNILSVGDSGGSGNVGINVQDAGATLDVGGTIRATNQNPIQFGSDASAQLTIQSSANTAGNMLFKTGSGNSTRMSITSGGNVGIGTIIPQGALTVMNGNVGIGTWIPAQMLDVENSGAAVQAQFGNTFPFYLISNSPNLGFNTYYSGAWKFGKGSSSSYGAALGFNQTSGDLIYAISSTTGNADATYTPKVLFDIDKNGNLGIGTTTPAGGLTVMNGNVGIGTWVPGSPLEVNGSIASFSSDPLFAMYDRDSNIDAEYLGANFDFSGATGYASFAINRNPSTGTFYNTSRAASQINLEDGNGNADIAFFTHTTNNTTPLERMRIKGNGNIGIGSTTPGQALDVQGTVRVSQAVIVNGSGPSNFTTNVGIGSATPGTALDVNGVARASGFTSNNCSSHSGQASCHATGGVDGYCTSVIGPGGACTCVAC